MSEKLSERMSGQYCGHTAASTWAGEVAVLEQKLAERDAKIAELEYRLQAWQDSEAERLIRPIQDSVRLDWLEANMPITLMRYRESECIGDLVQAGWEPNTAKNLRAAIDRALAAAATEPSAPEGALTQGGAR